MSLCVCASKIELPYSMQTNGNGKVEREEEKEGARTCFCSFHHPHPEFQGVVDGAGRENVAEEVVIQEDISAGEEGAGAGERNGQWGGKARDEKGNNRGGGIVVDEIVEDLVVRNTLIQTNLT